MPTYEEKMKALKSAVNQIEKEFGKGTVMRMSEKPAVDVDAIPSGSLLLDRALGIGGYPRGRIVEIYGPESGGKTTMALHAVAECQRKGGIAAFIDAEHALDPNYAKAVGVDVDSMYICQPDSGEQALEVADRLVQSGAVDICVIDSVAALVPKKELEGEMGDVTVGLQARLMSQALRKLTASVSKNNCMMIFINQIREKVGVMYGNPETTAGGRALKFYSSVRLDVRRVDTLKEAGGAVANKVRVKVVKNKVAPPFKEAIVTIRFGKGLDVDSEILDVSLANGEITKSGSWFYLKNGERIGQGADTTKEYINSHEELKKHLFEVARNEKKSDEFEPSNDEVNEQNVSELNEKDIVNE